MKSFLFLAVWIGAFLLSIGSALWLHEASHYAACINHGGLPTTSVGMTNGRIAEVTCTEYEGDLSEIYAMQEAIGYHSFALIAAFFLGILALKARID